MWIISSQPSREKRRSPSKELTDKALTLVAKRWQLDKARQIRLFQVNYLIIAALWQEKHDKVIIYVRGQTLKYLKSGGKCFKIKKVTLTYYTDCCI